jgi:hypothetical protein
MILKQLNYHEGFIEILNKVNMIDTNKTSLLVFIKIVYEVVSMPKLNEKHRTLYEVC